MTAKTQFIIVRVSPDFKKQVAKKAKSERRSVSDWARHALELQVNV